MGMFDWVNFEMGCPSCGGGKLNSFQSKDGECVLETIDAFSVDNFYDYCDFCEARIDFDRKKGTKAEPVIKRSLSDVLELFEMRVKNSKKSKAGKSLRGDKE